MYRYTQILSIAICLTLTVSVSAAPSRSEIGEALQFTVGPFNDDITVLGQYPSYVFIKTAALPRCGGAVVDESHIITLAQCVLDGNFRVYNPRLVEVIAGDLLWFPASATRRTRLASAIYVHPNYTAHTLENDIAVILTCQRCGGAVIGESHIVTLAQCVLDGNFHVFTPRLVRVFAGDLLWFPASATRQTRLASVIYVHPSFKAHTLENDIAPIRDRDVCNHVRYLEPVTERMICAGNLLAQGVAPCPGNIGSVLFCDGEATGLLSFGMNCVTANDPPTFTQIRYFNNWIDQQLTRTDVPLMNWSPLDV
ncbi:Trypsin [Culex quinquefasciatus]|uniref:Trypsin n=1 Tax=Culex quinquefasciatus TaxID=7176 RepID=B0WZE5_CULQU|nr:Trypsin [Culex quinquefasciatus]|eukprot:XP_001862767.1 Trypsin [Culex quinquefasciatus]